MPAPAHPVQRAGRLAPPRAEDSAHLSSASPGGVVVAVGALVAPVGTDVRVAVGAGIRFASASRVVPAAAPAPDAGRRHQARLPTGRRPGSSTSFNRSATRHAVDEGTHDPSPGSARAARLWAIDVRAKAWTASQVPGFSFVAMAAACSA